MTSTNQNFALLVEATWQSQPDRPAIFHLDRSISYEELTRMVDGWSAALRGLGAKAGDCVALWLPNSPAFVAAFLATLRLGAISVPMGVLLKPGEVRQRLDVTRPEVLVTTPDLARELREVTPRVLAVDPSGGDFGSADHAPAANRAAGDAAVLIFTSGTVGDARAAELTHGGILWNAQALADGLALRSDDVQFAAAPLSHVLGMTGVMNATLLRGGALALMERFDAPTAVPFIARTRTSGIIGAPPMFAALIREARRIGVAPRLRFAMAGGAALAPELARDVEETFGCVLRDGYGMSEVGGGVTHTPVDLPPRPGSVGPALPGSQLRIVDLVTGEPLPAGERGEVMVRSPSVMAGYRGNDGATREVLRADGWLSTGDIGYLDADGYLFLVDRKKDIIIRSGYNVYPREVEHVLSACPGVLEAAVVGILDHEHGEEVVALVVPEHEGALDPEFVKAFARERLAAYKYPRLVVVVKELPKGPTGKVLKRQIDVCALLARPSGDPDSQRPR